MRKTFLVLALAALVLASAGAVSASAGVKMRVSVPFGFFVEKDYLPAGVYIFEMSPVTRFSATGSGVAVRNLDGTLITWVSTMPGSTARWTDTDRLHFRTYGDKYFLSSVECLDYQAGLRATAAEKEIRTSGIKARETTLLALR